MDYEDEDDEMSCPSMLEENNGRNQGVDMLWSCSGN